MHVLLLLARVPLPDECARSSVDSRWLVALAAQHDVVVAVDENTDGCDVLREAGITVHVSDKRQVHLPGGGRVDADTALANWLATRHGEGPFDLVVASSERPSSGPVRDALQDVSWAVLAATGPTAHAQRLGADHAWLSAYAEELWFAASNVAAADIVLTPIDPAALGLDVAGPPVATLLPVPEPQTTGRATGELVVVVATGVTGTTATSLVEEALAAVDVHTATTIVVIHAPPVTGATDLAPDITAGVPTELLHQVVLAPAGRHEQVGAWLDAADALVLTGPSELLIPEVARRAALVPTVVLQADRVVPARTTRLLAAAPVTGGGRTPVELVPWTSPARLATELRALLSSRTAFVVVHDDEAAPEASRWLDETPMARFDVVIGATERPPWSMVNPHRLHGGIVGLHRRTWQAVADVVEDVGGLPELVARLTDPVGARSHTLGAITVRHEPATTSAPGVQRRPIELAGGPLPHLDPPPPPARDTQPPDDMDSLPDRSLRSWARESHWPVRARLALPWRLGLASAVRDGDFPAGVAQWAKRHTITDRARLLLPWKWGLLPRAMEGRW